MKTSSAAVPEPADLVLLPVRRRRTGSQACAPSMSAKSDRARKCDVRASAMPAAALADGRVALLVGNSTYAHIGLPNPENDAVDLAAALAGLGFDVTTELDADRAALTDAAGVQPSARAGRTSRWCSTREHGIELDGVNDVVPVDARLEATDGEQRPHEYHSLGASTT